MTRHNNRPKTGFSIPLGDATLNIQGEEFSNLHAYTIELRTATAHSTEIRISETQARHLVEDVLQQRPDVLEKQGYGPETVETAFDWAEVPRR